MPVLLALVALGVVLPEFMRWPERSGTPPGQSGGRRGGGGAPLPVTVLAAPVTTADVPVTIDGVGTARPAASVVVRPQVDGQLIEVRFREGVDVRKGDVLARIDPTTYKAQLDQAVAKKAQNEALLDNARRDLERYVRLAETNSVTKQQADTQRAAVAQLVAQLQADQGVIDNARAILAYTEIVSPIDGRTGIRTLDEGNLVKASDPAGLVTVSQIRPIVVLFSIPQQQLARIARAAGRGPLAVEALDADNARAVDQGTLQVIDNVVDATTGTVRMKAEFPNRELALWPGAFVNVRLRVETLRNVLVVPTAAVQRGPAGTFVYVVTQENTVAVKPVTVTQQDDTVAVIGTGVAAGERVVTTGFSRLAEGARVTVTEPTGAPPAPVAGPAEEERQRGQRRRENGQGPAPAAPGAQPTPAPTGGAAARPAPRS